MGNSLQDTPNANRIHIAFFGKMNSGKSSLINAFAGQAVSIVSDVGGTTTDLVKKPMEIYGIGACVLVDTAGFDDSSILGEQRIALTKRAADQADLAVLLCVDEDLEQEARWYAYLKQNNTPTVVVINKIDENNRVEKVQEAIEKSMGNTPLRVSARTGGGVEGLKETLAGLVKKEKTKRQITGNLLQAGDLVVLVMPQDIQAPEGRLILPQVQTLRELLDKKCLTMCVTTDKLDQALQALQRPPKLIITDSQAFSAVYEKKPKESLLTSFSMLFAAYKGDMAYFIEGAKKIGELKETDHVLIAECCTHAPLEEDIGRVKLPRMLRERVGAGLAVDVVSGTDFPQELSAYQLVIQCGACMFNRKYVMSRVQVAKEQSVPMTNYGVAIAYLKGILEACCYG